MIVLNVLPPSLKEEFELTRLKIAVRSFLAISVFSLVISVTAVVMSLWVSGFLVEVTAESSSALKSNTEIIEFNKNVNRIEAVQNLFFKYSDMFAPITNAIPKDVQITEISVNGEHQILTIIGNTEQKSLIFQVKENIQNLEGFSDVKLVTDELITKTRKSFTITAKVKVTNL